MAELDRAFLSSLVAEGLVGYQLTKGLISDDDFVADEEALKTWQFYRQHVEEYGVAPSNSLLKQKVDFEPDPVEDPLKVLVQEVRSRSLYTLLQVGLREVADHMRSQEPANAAEAVRLLAQKAAVFQGGLELTEPVFSADGVREVLEWHDRIASGERGIQTPWPTINEATFGFWPEDFVLFCARAGIGKTWIAAILAHHAWNTPDKNGEKKRRILFVTTEISKMRARMRFAALHAKTAYRDLTHGRLGQLRRRDLEVALKAIEVDDRIHIIGGNFNFELSAIESAIDRVRPDLVVVDGLYLIKGSGKTRTEQMANVYDEIKKLAKQKKLVLVGTTQFNREVKGNETKTAGTESIALSDAGAWNADLIFGVIRTKQLKDVKRIILQPLKVREGFCPEVTLYWDLDRMHFVELESSGGGGGDADEKDADPGDLPADTNDLEEPPF